MSRPLSVGVQLPEAERLVSWPEYRDMAIAVEQTGFDSIWVGDHLLYRNEKGTTGPWEAWSMLAAIGAVTERVLIGPLVAATSFHSPAMLAKKAATVDEISGGRLVLGLGAGWNRPEYEAYGFAFDHRAGRFEEAFTIIRTLLSEGSIDFQGEYYTLRDCELVPPARPDGPPLMIGSIGPRVLRATLPYVDSWNAWFAWFGNDASGLEAMLADIDRACREVGRDPSEVERTAAVMVAMPGSEGRSYGADDDVPTEAVPAAQLAELLVSYAALGVSHVQLVIDPITTASVQALGTVLAELDRS
jgi:alkanesulfonate monooxygenase SsuD/methylene tetrahydromethanopterin reductase-like flavin-dependent oxidoreductase (luciferase family)